MVISNKVGYLEICFSDRARSNFSLMIVFVQHILTKNSWLLALTGKITLRVHYILVHCQSVTAEESTVKGVEGTPAVFRWTVDRNNALLSSLTIFLGTEFNNSRILFSFNPTSQMFDVSELAKNYFKGRLKLGVSGNGPDDLKFNCTLTLNDLQLNDRNEQFLLYAAFVGVDDGRNVITLVEVTGIYWFLPFVSVIFLS